MILLVWFVTVTLVDYLRSRALTLTLTQGLGVLKLAHKHYTWIEVADSDKLTLLQIYCLNLLQWFLYLG